MKFFESINETSGKMTDAGEAYIKKSQEYFKLKVFQQISVSITFVIKALVIGSLLLIGLFFAAFALALAIGEWLDNLALGYLILGAVFILGCILVYYQRHLIERKVIKSLSSKFFNS
ncbi:hypothetical protein [Hanstruepera marina]|uniref:hypothetical protein n=1 Tax=Hanstruepera marina TaxID=2873265 RepID=UPI001CA62B09|nr:hypothetical protein [Hanstruepera marina]